jgi:hypothetical protein
LWARPHFQKLGEFIILQSQEAWKWLVINVPLYYDLASIWVANAWDATVKAIEGLMKA